MTVLKIKISVFFLMTAICSHASQYYSDTEKRRLVLDMLKISYSDAYELIKRYESAPDQIKIGNTILSFGKKMNFVNYISGTSEREIIKSINTVVHEICHGYTSRAAWIYTEKAKIDIQYGNEYLIYFIDADNQIPVRQTKSYMTNEMNATFPEKFKTFRYSTYIYPSVSEMSSQQYGVYGLLDELNAYYQGTRAAYYLLDYYMGLPEEDYSKWFDYFEGIYSTLYAYGEFTLYILHYLWHGKDRYPEVYSAVMNNDDFINAFKNVQTVYKELIYEADNIKTLITNKLKDKGLKVFEQDDYLFIGNTGKKIFLQELELLKEAIRQPRYDIIYKHLMRQ